MVKNILILIVLSFGVNNLSAYDLPEVNINTKQKPEIILFSAESVLVKEKLSYKITWKTINATDVQITYIGKMDLSGSITVTEDEYNRGPITLTASSRDSSFSDSQTINTNRNSDAPVTVFVKEEEDKAFYATPPLYPRGIRDPYRRRVIR